MDGDNQKPSYICLGAIVIAILVVFIVGVLLTVPLFFN
jgi:hypothetical protein